MLPEEHNNLLRIQSVCYVIPTVMHLVGLYSLYHVKHIALYDNQRMYLFHLSLSEFLICSLKIVHRLCELYSLRDAAFRVWLIQTGTFFTAYVLIMTLLTLDRYLAVSISLKYPLWITKRKTGYCLVTCWIASVVFTVVFSLKPNQNEVRYIVIVYLWPIEELLFLFIAILTYTYIFVKIRHNRKCSIRLVTQLQSVNYIIPIASGNIGELIHRNEKPPDATIENTVKSDINEDINDRESNVEIHPGKDGSCKNNDIVNMENNNTKKRRMKEREKLRNNNNSLKRIKQRLYLPSLLIATFVLFWILPDQVEFFYSVNSIPVTPMFSFKINIFYVLALSADALIYVLGISQIRKQIFNFWKRKSTVDRHFR